MRSMYLVTTFFTLILFQAGYSATWDYSNQEAWPPLCQDGKNQSPIDLDDDSAEEKDFPPLTFNTYYHQVHPAIIQNNGHSVEVRIQSQGKPSVEGGSLYGFFVLDHLHFHWSSEHTIEDYRYPLELHLVHYSQQYPNFAEALKHSAVAVLSVLFELSPENDDELMPLTEMVLQLNREKIGQTKQLHLELEELLPRDTAGYFSYMGSLTTPNCTEGIQWIVFTNTLPISQYQLDGFKNLKSGDTRVTTMDNNYRSLQPTNDRKVYLQVSPVHNSSMNNLLMYKELLIVVLFYHLYNLL